MVAFGRERDRSRHDLRRGAGRNLARIQAGRWRRLFSRRPDTAVLPGGGRIGRGRRSWIEARPRWHRVGGYGPRITTSPDGRLWFLPGSGVVSVIDPRHIPVNKVPPRVHIERIVADDKPYDLRPGMRLPANVRNLRIEYTALSLIAPEKVHFKYKLEGQNRNWHEVINERQAFYTNLPPSNYRFRVMASNNTGVWNETG